MTLWSIMILGSAVAAIIAIVIYAVRRKRQTQRALAHPPTQELANRLNVDRARQHAWWTALIALIACGALSPRPNVGSVKPSSILQDSGPQFIFPGLEQWERDNFWLATINLSIPMVLLAAIFIVSQFTWPEPTGRVRSASLQRRTIARLLPVSMTMAFGLAIVCYAATAWFVYSIAGKLPERVQSGPDSFTISAGIPSGKFLVTISGISVTVLSLGLITAMWVISQRRSVPGLSHENDALSRTIAITRMLRWAVLLVSGSTAAIAIALPTPTVPAWVGWLAWANVAIGILVVVAIRSPRLQEQHEPVTPSSDEISAIPKEKVASAVRWHTIAGRGVAAFAILSISLGMVFYLALLNVLRNPSQPSESVTWLAVCGFTLGSLLPWIYLVAAEARFAWISRGNEQYTEFRVKMGWFTWILVSLIATPTLAAVGWGLTQLDKPPAMLSLIILALQISIALVIIWIIRHRQSYFAEPEDQDIDAWLRQASLMRVARLTLMAAVIVVLPIIDTFRYAIMTGFQPDNPERILNAGPSPTTLLDSFPLVVLALIVIVLVTQIPALQVTRKNKIVGMRTVQPG